MAKFKPQNKPDQEVILKIQRPVAYGDPLDPQVLIYNEDNSIMFEWPLSTPGLRKIFGRRFKVYCLATYSYKTGIVTLGEDAPNQNPGW